jgi:hypothetical protein
MGRMQARTPPTPTNRGGLRALRSMFLEYPTIVCGTLVAPTIIYLLSTGLGDEAVEIKRDAWGLALTTSDGSSKAKGDGG